jgi:hypothetical protein
VRDCRCGNEEIRHWRRSSSIDVVRRRFAEEKPESRPSGPKVRRRCQREVELQPLREQEHPVDRRSALEVDEAHGAVLGPELLRPVVEHLSRRNVVGDAEGQVQIGEPVARSSRERSDRRSGDDAPVLLRELQHMRAECIALRDGEHVDVVSG